MDLGTASQCVDGSNPQLPTDRHQRGEIIDNPNQQVHVGTVSSLMDRLRRKSALPPIQATHFGFTVGESFFPWQTISEIWGYKVDRLTTDEAFLEFLSGSQRVSISEEQQGFGLLEASMIAAFPVTATWRQAILQPAFDPCRRLLYRRA